MSNIIIKGSGAVNISVGNKNVLAVYLGDKLVWPAANFLLTDDVSGQIKRLRTENNLYIALD